MLSRNEPTLLSEVESAEAPLLRRLLRGAQPGRFRALVQAATRCGAGRRLIVRRRNFADRARGRRRGCARGAAMAPLPCQAGGLRHVLPRRRPRAQGTCRAQLGCTRRSRRTAGSPGFFPNFDGKEENPRRVAPQRAPRHPAAAGSDPGCSKPCVGKMGTRTFLENEVKSSSFAPTWRRRWSSSRRAHRRGRRTHHEIEVHAVPRGDVDDGDAGWRIEAVVKPGQPKFDQGDLQREQLDDAPSFTWAPRDRTADPRAAPRAARRSASSSSPPTRWWARRCSSSTTRTMAGRRRRAG